MRLVSANLGRKNERTMAAELTQVCVKQVERLKEGRMQWGMNEFAVVVSGSEFCRVKK